MLKRICDRCGKEIPVEQTMDNDELILRKINGKPFDICESCQSSLKKWAAVGWKAWVESKKKESENKCSCYHVEWGKARCWGTKEKDECDCGGDERRCNFYPEKRKVNDDTGKDHDGRRKND
jgi:hypothetical protein